MLRQRQRAAGVGGNDRYRLHSAVGVCPLPCAAAVAAAIVEQHRAQRCQRQPVGGLLLRRQVAPQMVERRFSVQSQQIQDAAAGLHRRAAKRLPAPGNGEIDARAAQFDPALPRQAAVLPGRRIGLPGRAALDSCSGAGLIRNSERFRRPALLLALLTTAGPAVKLVPMKAKLISRFRDVADDDSLIEMVVWHVPVPVPPSGHCHEYRLVYVVAGQRVIGFDNERGKGDHHHVGSAELPYVFQGVDRLIDDFVEEVERWKREH